jgi:DNA primase
MAARPPLCQEVWNPFAKRLGFLDTRTRARRDFPKYLTLIRAIALLHQYQRPVKVVRHRGEEIRYIEVSCEDIRLANELVHEVLGRSLDELPPQTRRLLGLVEKMVRERSEKLGVERRDFRFSRRDVREATGASYEQLRVHLGRLVELEYLLVHRGGRGQSFVYELVYDGAEGGAPRVFGLIDPSELGDPEQSAAGAGTAGDAGTTASLGGEADEFGGPLGAHTGDKPGGLLPAGSLSEEHRNGSERDRESAANDSTPSATTSSNTAVVGATVVRLSQKRARSSRLRQAAEGC